MLLAVVRRVGGGGLSLARRFAPGRILATFRWAIGLYRATRGRRRVTSVLTVGIDVNPLWEPLTGVGWYLHLLLRSLAECQGVHLRLYGPALVGGKDAVPPAVELPSGSAIELVSYPLPEDLSLPPGILGKGLRAFESLLVAGDGNRVLFAPNFFLPGRFALCRGAVVATVHDLAFLRHPWTLREATRRDLARHLKRTMSRARRVITPSYAVRAELIEEGLAEAETVAAVHHGPGHLQSSKGELPPGLSLPDPFVLHVGTLEPRKNVSTLLEAWRRLSAEGDLPASLVLCGGFGWKSDSLKEEVEAAEGEGWLRYLGYVDDAVLASLFRSARLVVSPSLYEGFGLPLVEALLVATPVVCSDLAVFREVAQEGARFVPARDVGRWVEAIAELLDDEAERLALGRRGQRWVRAFDWQRSGRETLSVWQAAASP